MFILDFCNDFYFLNIVLNYLSGTLKVFFWGGGGKVISLNAAPEARASLASPSSRSACAKNAAAAVEMLNSFLKKYFYSKNSK